MVKVVEEVHEMEAVCRRRTAPACTGMLCVIPLLSQVQFNSANGLISAVGVTTRMSIRAVQSLSGNARRNSRRNEQKENLDRKEYILRAEVSG